MKRFFSFCFLLLTIYQSSFAQNTSQNNFGTPSPIPGCPYLFTRDLQIGSTGIDVKILQQILNTDRRTRIADSGPGSPGQETLSFGAGTREALKRFQALFIEYVGTANGKVNTKTVTILNAICSNKKETAATSTPVTKDITAPEIKLSADNTSIMNIMKFNIEGNEAIKKPGPDAIICDGCQVADIRKLSPKSYLVVLTLNEGAKRVDVQIEANKVSDLAGNTNETASEILTFTTKVNLLDGINSAINTLTDTVGGIFKRGPSEDATEPDETFPNVQGRSFVTLSAAKNDASDPYANVIGPGERVTLSWSYTPLASYNTQTNNSQFCYLNGGDQNNTKVNYEGSLIVSPTASTKYTVTCFDQGEYRNRGTVFIDVTSDNNNPGVNLKSDVYMTSIGGYANLSWSGGYSAGDLSMLNPKIVAKCQRRPDPQGCINTLFQMAQSGDKTVLANPQAQYNTQSSSCPGGVLAVVIPGCYNQYSQTTQMQNGYNNLSNCTLDGGEFNNTPVEPSGTRRVQVFKRTIYTITCNNNGTNVSDSVGIIVNNPSSGTFYGNINDLNRSQSGLSSYLGNQSLLLSPVSNNPPIYSFTTPNGGAINICSTKYTIDWGDGSEQQVGNGTGYCGNIPHNYRIGRRYTIMVYDSSDKLVGIFDNGL